MSRLLLLLLALCYSACGITLENAMTLRYSRGKRSKNRNLALIVPFTMTPLNQDT